MSDLLNKAIDDVLESEAAFAKFLSANDTGNTGSHQYGVLVPKKCAPLLFYGSFKKGETPPPRGASILWNGEVRTVSSFQYYGAKTRDEYRITRFGRDFKFLKPDKLGSLLVICRKSSDRYYAYVFSEEEDIEGFLDAFSISDASLPALIKGGPSEPDPKLNSFFEMAVLRTDKEIPNTKKISSLAREARKYMDGGGAELGPDPDRLVKRLIDLEYDLYQLYEEEKYAFLLDVHFGSIKDMFGAMTPISNSRRVRAGKSVENQLEYVLEQNGLSFTPQAHIEGKTVPDFIFPSVDAYNDPNYPEEGLTYLASKRTLRERWYQILPEADRIPQKYLFTLDSGLRGGNLETIREKNIVLVVPEEIQKEGYFPSDVVGERV